MKILKLKTITILLAAICAAAFALPQDIETYLTNHFAQQAKPVTFTTDDMIALASQRVEAKLNPYYSNYMKLKYNASDQLSDTITPYTGTDSEQASSLSRAGFSLARNCAIVWRVEGVAAYRDYGKQILLSWARAMPEPLVHMVAVAGDDNGDANLGIRAAASTIFYCHAYSLLYDEFTTGERADIELWLGKIADKFYDWQDAWVSNNYYGGQDYNNHLSWYNAAMGYLGFVLQDVEYALYAIDSIDNPRDFKDMLAGAILMPGDTVCPFDPDQQNITAGEMYDRYRTIQGLGLDYAVSHGMALLYLAEAAYNNGLDFYSYTAPGGENLSLVFSYYSDFLVEDDSSIKGGYYDGDSIPSHHRSNFELANFRYPGLPEVLAVPIVVGRATPNNHSWQHFATVSITHSAEFVDLTGDKFVGLDDFAVMASQWKIEIEE